MSTTQLHLGTIARSPSDSIRPDLWPDHAWIPALGVQGGTLFDVAGGKNGVITGATWFGNTLIFDASGDYVTMSTAPACLIGSYTIFIDLTPTNQSAVVNGAASTIINFYLGSANKLWFFTYQNKFQAGVNGETGKGATTNIESVNGTRYRIAIVFDGTSTTLYNYGTNVTSLNCSYHAATAANYFGAFTTTTGSFGGTIHHVSIYPNVLTPAQILDLSADPLLPFRRKTFVSFYVPDAFETFTSAIWNYSPRSLTAGSPAASTTLVTDYAAAVWAWETRTLTGGEPAAFKAYWNTRNRKTIGLGVI